MLPRYGNRFRLCLILPLMTILTGCATPPAPPAVADACSWATMILPDPGFESRWTASEKRQVDAYDRTVEKLCRTKSPNP